jgi:hypothetical protein
MKYLLKWMVTFLAFALVGYLAGKALDQLYTSDPNLFNLHGPFQDSQNGTQTSRATAPPDSPMTNTMSSTPDGHLGSENLVIWPFELEGIASPYVYEKIEAWLLVGSGVLHWFDRWPLALSLPPGEYTLIIKREAGSVQVIPLRVGPLPIEEFAFR